MPHRVVLMPTVLSWIWRSCHIETEKRRRVGVGASVEFAHIRFKNCHNQRHIAFIFSPIQYSVLVVFLWCKLINAIPDSIDKSLRSERFTANMSSLKKNWKYEEVQALIHLVRKYPSLYDRRDPDYNQARTKEVNIPPIHSSVNCHFHRIFLAFHWHSEYMENDIGIFAIRR